MPPKPAPAALPLESPARAPYSHRFHAGNVGDVWKHCALLAVISRLRGRGNRICVLDTHAGEGRYKLGATGEWTEGLGKLWGEQDAPWVAERTPALDTYLEAVHALSPPGPRPVSIPGSPALALQALGPEDALWLWETDDGAAEVLARRVGADPRVRISTADGPAALLESAQQAVSAGFLPLALIDPPYSDRAEWQIVPRLLAAAVRVVPTLRVLLWYPIKSLTRPNAMLAALRAAGVPGITAELVTTPLELQRKRLNGSGVLLVRPPAGAVSALAGCAPALGAACSTVDDQWSSRIVCLGETHAVALSAQGAE